MPIFEFKCDSCGKEFERLCFASDNIPVECPECGSGKTTKVLSVFSSTGLDSKLAHSCGSHSGSS